nr:hypothetical protein [uncultured bacterium]
MKARCIVAAGFHCIKDAGEIALASELVAGGIESVLHFAAQERQYSDHNECDQ